MKKKSIRTAFCLALVGAVLAAFVAIAADVGTQGDPLVTLSYLNDVFMEQIMGRVDEKITGRNETLRGELQESITRKEQELLGRLGGNSADSSGGMAVTYMEVQLEKGQVLYGAAGCEVMLRSGSARCVSDAAPGLVDTTGGSTINNGSALKKDHLYMMPDARGVQAEGSTTLLVRGEYSLS